MHLNTIKGTRCLTLKELSDLTKMTLQREADHDGSSGYSTRYPPVLESSVEQHEQKIQKF